MKLGALLVACACALALAGCGGTSTEPSDAAPAAPSSAQGDGTNKAADFHPVAGNFTPDDTKLEGCLDQACYEQAFGNIAFYEGPKAALELFDEKIAKPGPIESDCHRIAHTIGSAALARFDGNVAKAFAEGSASCWSGYYHGILERAFAGVSTTSVEALGTVARGLCDDAGVRAITWIAYQCVHGLGHGLMINSGYNLPFSLDVCEQLATDWDRTSCKGGVFMENISTSYGVQSEWVREDDGVYPCNAVEEDDKLYCYLMVTSRVLRVEDWDWKKTAEICAGVEKGWVSTCFRSYGRDASGTTRQNPEEVAKLCRVAGTFGGEGDCLDGAAKDMTANYASGEQAAILCTSAPDDLRGGCFYAVGSVLGTFFATSEERRTACAAITATETYVAQCLRAADPGAAT
jgi:hypothetical protein